MTSPKYLQLTKEKCDMPITHRRCYMTFTTVLQMSYCRISFYYLTPGTVCAYIIPFAVVYSDHLVNIVPSTVVCYSVKRRRLKQNVRSSFLPSELGALDSTPQVDYRHFYFVTTSF